MDVADFAKHVYKMLERREQDIATILTSGGIQIWKLPTSCRRDARLELRKRRNEILVGEKLRRWRRHY